MFWPLLCSEVARAALEQSAVGGRQLRRAADGLARATDAAEEVRLEARMTELLPALVSAPTALGRARQVEMFELVTRPTKLEAHPDERPVTSEGSS